MPASNRASMREEQQRCHDKEQSQESPECFCVQIFNAISITLRGAKIG